MKRLIELDMLRGYALIAIMINHMPISVLRVTTIANWSIFDASELFVLLSGFLVGLVWLRVEQREGRATAQKRFARRAFEVWRAMVIGALVMALLSAILLTFGLKHTAIWNAYARWVIEEPLLYALKVGSLWLQPNLVDVLAVYVILLGCAPVLVPILMRFPLAFAAGSVSLWWFAPVLGPILPNYNPKGILFNPFGWQLLFYTGVAFGLFRHKFMPVLMRFQGPISFVATIMFLFGAAITIAPRFGDAALPIRLWMRSIYGNIDKWSLDGTRYLAIIAASWLVAVPFSRPIRWFSDTVLGRAMQEIGKGGLWSFIICVLLSVLGDALQMNPPEQGIASRLVIDLWVILVLWYASWTYRLVKQRRAA